MHAVQQINHALLTLPVDIYLQISFRTNNFSKQCSVNISFNPFELIIDFCFCLKKRKLMHLVCVIVLEKLDYLF